MQYFQEICKVGNFTKAAANLFVAQPAVTNAIRKLEAELGLKLLNRTNKAVSLTPEGLIFFERSRLLLESFNGLKQEMLDATETVCGSLKIGVPPQTGAFLFPNIFPEFSSRYPNLILNVFEEGAAAITSLLESGELDVGIFILMKPSPLLNTKIIRREPFLLCVSSQHPLSSRSIVDFSELRNEKFILRKPNSSSREIVLNLCQKHDFTPNVLLSSNQIQTIKSLVAKNAGIAFFMGMSLKNDFDIVSIPLTEPYIVDVCIAWKKGKYVSKSIHVFIDFIAASCGDGQR